MDYFPEHEPIGMNELSGQIEGQMSLLPCQAEPDLDTIRSVIYRPHLANLVVLLVEIFLIDTECIDPGERKVQVPLPGRFLGAP
jgi:hypothetical protein